MARNRVHIDANPEAVFDVLADPGRYSRWVVGTVESRDREGPVTEAGVRFNHRVGLGPFVLRDETEVVELDRPRRLVLDAKVRPLGVAHVVLTLTPAAGGTNVRMEERAADRTASLLANPIADVGLRLRNAEALMRLKRLVEGEIAGTPATQRRTHRRRHRRIAGQRVLITGGSSGIGLATAELLGRQGATVTLLARGERGLKRAADRLGRHGVAVRTVSADITDRGALRAAVDEAARAMGGIDVVVAAGASVAFGRFVETSAEDFDATVATVLGGAVDTVRQALPHVERAAGAVVVIGSTAGHMPVPGLSAYAASKHGLVGFVDTLRVELREAGSPVTASLVSPGPVDTPLWSRLDSATGLLPPVPPARYDAAAVAEAVAGVIRHPRGEVTVGALARAQVGFVSLLRDAATPALVAVARFAQSAGDRSSNDGALHEPHGDGEVSGGFGGRPSVAVKARAAWDELLAAVGGR